MTEGAREVLACLKGKRFPLEDEKQTQALIADALSSMPDVRREMPVERGVIDFFVSDGTGVEVKLKGQRSEIVRQITRYLHDDRILALVLVTAKPVAVPQTINGKPVRVVNLGEAWL